MLASDDLSMGRRGVLVVRTHPPLCFLPTTLVPLLSRAGQGRQMGHHPGSNLRKLLSSKLEVGLGILLLVLLVGYPGYSTWDILGCVVWAWWYTYLRVGESLKFYDSG